MALEIEAIYENGILKLPRPLPLEDGLTVKITIHPPRKGVKKGYGLISWQGSHEELERLATDPEFHPEEGP
jgi:predicted DNA-binding antitoxin AbrB/MazE fold protein